MAPAISDLRTRLFIIGVSDHLSFVLHEKNKNCHKMTETYSGRTTFGDINFTPDQIDEYKDAFEVHFLFENIVLDNFTV